MDEIKDKGPCSSTCFLHITHPCEKCGRLLGLEMPDTEWTRCLSSSLQSAREERNIIVTNLSFLLGGLGLSNKAPDMTGIYEDEFFSLGESIIKERDTLKAEADRMREAIEHALDRLSLIALSPDTVASKEAANISGSLQYTITSPAAPEKAERINEKHFPIKER